MANNNNNSGFRVPKPERLKENETITGFASWKQNLKYNLSLNNDWAPFLEPDFEWSKPSTPNRGVAADGDDVDANRRKTAVQKGIQLDRMIGYIAQYSPSLLYNDITNRSTSLDWIWKRIRKYYSFHPSEVNFLKLDNIKRETNERYETLFQRIIAHLEDNLLTTDSDITYEGEPVDENEELTPTCERLAVYLWLILIDKRLPTYIMRVYSHDLQTMSLKDLQPQICDAMDSLLAEINNQEDIQTINFSRSSYNNRNNNSRPFSNRTSSSRNDDRSQQVRFKLPTEQRKECVICKAAGKNSVGHTVATCWQISKADKLQIAKALQVSVQHDEDPSEDCNPCGDEGDLRYVMDELIDTVTQHNTTHNTPSASTQVSTEVRRVRSSVSPYFFAFIEHHTVKIIVDTGATSTLVSASFVKKVGITILPTRHSARQLDKSKVPLTGEVKFIVSFGDITLFVDGLVNDSIDCDILAGSPFCEENAVDLFPRKREISIGDGENRPPVIIKYGSQPDSIQHDIYRVESTVLRNNSPQVLLPGEYVELKSPDFHRYEGEIALEPRVDSPLDGEWPQCAITRVINGVVRIPNNTDEPIHLRKSTHLGHIRRVTSPSDEPKIGYALKVPASPKPTLLHSSTISVDPSGSVLTEEEKSWFSNLHVAYDRQFRPDVSVYNGYSGNLKAYIDMGPIPPPPNKPKMPLYNQSNLQNLQDESDKLEKVGVLAKPEDVGVKVRHASPSFLVKKPDGTFRLVTAFNQLGQYVRYPPSTSITCDEVLRRLASWKFIIKTDMKKAYYQIPMAKSSMQWLGTHTPFGGLRVYTRPVMGMPGSAEFLQELLTRVFGEYTRQGFVIIIADDMHVCGNTIQELYQNWEIVLKCCQLNNLTLSAPKTIICPITAIVLGWVWSQGTITASAHKTSPLAVIEPPKTCSAMRSFIGAFKAISRCIKNYASLMSPLEHCIKGMQGTQQIVWSDELREHFKRAQAALKSPAVLTLPTPSDKLILTADASPMNDGIGATLFLIRDEKRLLAEFFSFKLKSHQIGWQPCELEALAITAGVYHFSPYIRESKHPLQVLSDSKPCVQAFKKLCSGKFSASARVSTFLSCLSEHNVTVQHLKGEGNTSSDFASRHPNVCSDSSCQVCEFVHNTADSVVRAVTAEEVLSGSARIPFYNKNAWKSAQQNCPALRKTHTYMVNGTRPSRKVKHITDVRRYLEVCTLNGDGLLVCRKSDPYMFQRELIVVPADVLNGLLTALHIYFNHATLLQLKKIFHRYFFALNTQPSLESVVDSCMQCTALKKVPKEVFTQTSSPSAEAPGQSFAADVIRRSKQCIFAIRDIHTSFTVASLIPDEKSSTLQSALITSTASIRLPTCTIRVDSAPGLFSLRNDPGLLERGITLDYGRVKNLNKNPVAERCNQELELELLHIDPTGAPVTEVTLQDAVHILNSRVRNRELSAREILFCRDQITSAQLNIDDNALNESQQRIRQQNHIPSARSKSKSGYPPEHSDITVGSLVYLKKEGDKFQARDSYIVVSIKDHIATLQKITSTGRFMSRSYDVPLGELFPAVKHQAVNMQRPRSPSSSSSDDDEQWYPTQDPPAALPPPADPTPPLEVLPNDGVNNIVPPRRNPVRSRREPDWLGTDIWDRE